MNIRLRSLAVACIAAAATMLPVVWSSPARAESAREILDRRKTLDDTVRRWTDRHQRLHITVTDKVGELVRELDLYERKLPGDEQQSVLFFTMPADVKGMGFLAYTHKSRPADQWLFLPELATTRRIAGRARGEKFVGTDLSFHDLDLLNEMPAWTEEDAASSLRSPESADGVPCHVIEYTTKRDDIGYKKVVLWLGTDDLVPRRLEFWEDPSAATKRLRQSDVRTIGAIPLPHKVEVETLAAGSKTTIDVLEAQFNLGLEEDLFTQRGLERGKR